MTILPQRNGSRSNAPAVSRLAAFVAATAVTPFTWGENDCALWCASAVAHCTGYDPASDLRGAYSDFCGARALQMQAGGLVALIAPRMQHPRLTPLKGDGVAILNVGDRQICAIVLGGRAIRKTGRGLLMDDDFRVVEGWSWASQSLSS